MTLTCRSVIGFALSAFVACSMMPSPATAQEVEIAVAVAATEGPTVDQDGNVYFTEMASQRIMRLGKEGVLSTYRRPDGRRRHWPRGESRPPGLRKIHRTGRGAAG